MNYTLDAVRQAVGVTPDVGPNQPYTDASQLIEFLSEEKPIILPKIGTVNDEDQVGDGSRFGRKILTTYYQQGSWTETGRLNDHIATIFLFRHLAGVITPSIVLAAGVGNPSAIRDYSITQNVYNTDPKLCTIYRELGPEIFLHQAGVNRFLISQEGENEPRWTADMLGTGFYLDEEDLTGIPAPGFDASNIVPCPDYEYFHGAGTEFTFTDGVTNYNFPANEGLLSHEIESNNNMIIKPLPGDIFKIAGDRRSGAIPKRIAHGKQTGAIRCKIYLGPDLNAWKSYIKAKKLTGLKITYNGYNKINGSIYDFEYEISAPNCQFNDVTGDREDVHGALSLEIVPQTDFITKGRFTGRVRTNKTFVV